MEDQALPPMKKYAIVIHKNGTPLTQLELEIPISDISLAGLVPSLQRLFDRILEAEIDDPGQISCREGCEACCRQLIPISIPEAFFLNDLIRSLPLKKQTELRQRFRHTMNLVQRAGWEADLKNPRRNPDLDQLYFQLNTSCPFLEDRRCTIYPSRPLVCREYHVKNPAEDCADPYHHSIQKLKFKRNLGALLAVFSAHLYSLPPNPIPLILVSNWVEEHPNLATQKWPGTWLFDKFLHGLTRLNDQQLEITAHINPDLKAEA